MKIRGSSVCIRDKHASVCSISHRQFGFSVIEVLVSLVLLAVGAALSIPSFQAMTEKRQLADGAEQIVEFVYSAQKEAIKRDRLITFSARRAAVDQWCIGASMGTAACDCTETNQSDPSFCTIDTEASIINSEIILNTELLGDAKTESLFSFDPKRGVTGVLGEPIFLAVGSDSGHYLLDLNVSNTGKLSICSTDATHAVPEYAVCQL